MKNVRRSLGGSCNGSTIDVGTMLSVTSVTMFMGVMNIRTARCELSTCNMHCVCDRTGNVDALWACNV